MNINVAVAVLYVRGKGLIRRNLDIVQIAAHSEVQSTFRSEERMAAGVAAPILQRKFIGSSRVPAFLNLYSPER